MSVWELIGEVGRVVFALLVLRHMIRTDSRLVTLESTQEPAE